MSFHPEREAKLKALARKLGYKFNDLSLLELALTHRSQGANNNERLEFLGDSLVNFIIADSLFHRFTKLPEGDLSRIRAHLVKGDTLADMGRELDLSLYLNLGPGELKSGGYRRDSIISDAMEAIFAAVYQDGGLEECIRLVVQLYTSRLDKLDPSKVGKDSKTRLQEYLQSQQEPLPEYSIISVNGAAHDQQFTVACYIAKLNRKFEAVASSRRKAEQAAAEIALKELGEL